MTRRPDGTWELTARDIRGLTVLLPMLQLVFAAGGAWMAVRVGLQNKLDRSEFVDQVKVEALAIQSLRTADSLQLELSRDLANRVREIVCYRDTRPACR